MRKLLRAGLRRLFTSRSFLLSCAAMFAAGAALPVIHYFDNLNNQAAWSADSSCFIYAYLAPIMCAIVSALFIGCDYSDGTMRNKLIAGHRRYNIYLSDLICCICAGIMLSLAYALPHTCLGLILLGGFTTDAGTLIACAGVSLALIAAFAALFTLIALLCTGKAGSIAACILLTFALLFVGIRITSALNEPEYFSGYSYTQGGVTVDESETKNPYYLSGAKRGIYEFLNSFTPGGQVLLVAGLRAEAADAAMLLLYDAVILLGATGCGILFFRKKDLK